MPFAGPKVVKESAEAIRLSLPVARNPLWPIAVAAVVAVVVNLLPRNILLLPDCARAPVVAADLSLWLCSRKLCY